MDYSNPLTWFLYILPPYLFQLALAEGMFCCRLKIRRFLLPRLLASALVCAAALWLAARALTWQPGPDGVVITAVYLALFFLTVGVLKLCFQVGFATLLFYGIAAYATQNLAYRIYSIFELTGAVWRLGDRIGPTLAYLLCWNGIFAVVASAVYLIFTRPMLRQDAAALRNLKVYALSGITMTVTVVLCSWTNVYAGQSNALTMIICLFSCVCCIFILCLQSGMLQTEGLRQDLAVLRQLWEQDRKQYELSKENIGLINIKCHDLRFRLQALRNSEGDVSREELEEIENAISIYDSRVSTGCEPLDTILTEKSLFCTKNGIRFTCMAEGSRLLFITPADLYSLLGNIISNAVEAVRKVEDPEYRVITLVVKPVGEMLLISEENYFSGRLEFQDGLPVTSKADKLEHGYGMKSIRMLTKKYGGDLRVNVKDNLFSLTLLFPLEK